VNSLDEYLRDAEQAHGHLCAGQVLGVRLAMLGLQKLGIDDPRGKDRKRLVTFVEIDRCATDAVAVVTGCRLGKRALKFRDWGKVAATFVDVSSGKAIRIAAKESRRRWLARCILKSQTRTSSRCWPIVKSPTKICSLHNG
jgi:formylmethanofuran dehydrogenase subunit E